MTKLVGTLARLGFVDPSTSARWAADSAIEFIVAHEPEQNPHSVPEFFTALSFVPDPDGALRALVRILDTASGRRLLGPVASGERGKDERDALFCVVGSSTQLAEFLLQHPESWAQAYAGVPSALTMRARLLTAIGADPTQDLPVGRGGQSATLDDLRVAYRTILLAIAAADVTHPDPFDYVGTVAEQLAELAAAALEAALAIARGDTAHHEMCQFAIIGMGKCGGRELNYVSDVDVLYVSAPTAGATEEQALQVGAELAAKVGRICSTSTAEGSLWPVDVGLRPEGKNGALTRTLASYEEYYVRWAKTWEFQALLKARVIAGDIHLGARFMDMVTPLVWDAASRPNFVTDVQKMRRRVEQNIPAKAADRQLKLGAGGIRDVEFSVQLLQLVHGRTDNSLRHRATLSALGALVHSGYVSRSDGAQLATHYRFLRVMEHRNQLYKLKRTHVVPPPGPALRRMARSMHRATEADIERDWKRTKRSVRSLHESLFYRPLLELVSRLSSEDVRMTPDHAKDRLRALGYADAAGALTHIKALTTGVSRRAAIQRQLLPVLLEWFAGGAKPDAGLLAFRQVSDTLGRTHWYLKLLRDSGAAAERLAGVLTSGNYVVTKLERDPQAIQWLADREHLVPRSTNQLGREIAGLLNRTALPEAVHALRGFRRRELLRISMADVLNDVTITDVGVGLKSVTGTVIDAALMVSMQQVAEEHSITGAFPVSVSVLGMGRYGGGEPAYSSDVDVLFVHDHDDSISAAQAAKLAVAVVSLTQNQLKNVGTEPPLLIDADLRPEGRSGPLSRSLAAYRTYYERWSSPWEAQALIRATPIAGDPVLAKRFISLIDPLRYPEGGLNSKSLREVRRLKARMEAERLPRGVSAKRHLKLGPGGLSDIEWLAQLMVMQHAQLHPQLRCTGTIAALKACASAGLINAATKDELVAAWEFLSRCRNAITLWFGKGGDVLPGDYDDMEGVARLLGYDVGEGISLEEDVMRVMRRTRTTVEPLFFGE